LKFAVISVPEKGMEVIFSVKPPATTVPPEEVPPPEPEVPPEVPDPPLPG
jgi:hypothetical protein